MRGGLWHRRRDRRAAPLRPVRRHRCPGLPRGAPAGRRRDLGRARPGAPHGLGPGRGSGPQPRRRPRAAGDRLDVRGTRGARARGPRLGRAGASLEATWARLDLASCLIRMNRHGESVALIGQVRETADSLGSPPLQSRADELARTSRARGTTEEAWWPLTAREFEVARLVAEGLTNAEIAERLTIAPKTASAHIEHILAKLGVTRRAEIAAWAASIVGPGAAGNAA